MSFRQLNKKCLTLSLYKLKAFNRSTVMNINGIPPSFYSSKANIFLNDKQTYRQIARFYSDQSRVEELIVDYAHVKKALSDKNTLLVDVREPEEIKEHGKIPNSVNIPLGNVTTALNTMSDNEFEQNYGRKKPAEDTEIIFYCMIGKRSGMAQQNAIGLGFRNVKNYIGSWTDWATKNQ